MCPGPGQMPVFSDGLTSAWRARPCMQAQSAQLMSWKPVTLSGKGGKPENVLVRIFFCWAEMYHNYPSWDPPPLRSQRQRTHSFLGISLLPADF